jgi:hypothetical protein
MRMQDLPNVGLTRADMSTRGGVVPRPVREKEGGLGERLEEVQPVDLSRLVRTKNTNDEGARRGTHSLYQVPSSLRARTVKAG